MNVITLTAALQSYCNSGYALDEIEIYDRDGNLISVPEKVELTRDHEKEVVKIEVHHLEVCKNEKDTR